MAAERRLTVVLAGDSKGLTTALGQAETSTGRFGSKIGGLGTKAKVALAGATTAVFAFGKASVDAYVESEQAQTRLEDAFSKFPQLANGNIDALRRLNEELARKTKFDDDATASGQAVLAQFGLTQDQLSDITPLLQDYAAKTGKDLPSAANDLGKAMMGQGKAMKAIGVDFKDSGTKAGNLEQIMGGLRSQVGGFAEKEGATAAGKAQILSNQFGELQEKVGAKLVPALTALTTAGLAVVNFISNLSPGVQIAIGVVAGLAASVFVIVKAVQAWTAVQTALNVVLAANPIGLVIIAVAGFVAGLVIAYQKVGWFRDLVNGAFTLIKNVIMGAFNWVKSNWPLLLGILTGPIGAAVYLITTHWNTIKAGVTAVKDWIVARFNEVTGFLNGVASKIGSAASRMWNGLKNGLAAAVEYIRRMIDRALGPLDELLGKLAQLPNMSLTGSAFSKSELQALAGERALGGPVAAGRTYLVGERGPELVTMGGNGFVTPNHMLGGGGQVVHNHVWHVQGSILTERDLLGLLRRAEAKGI